jgi:hypothetical protein
MLFQIVEETMSRPVQAISWLIAAAALWVPLRARAADPTTADCLAANKSSVDLRNDLKLRAARAQLLVCASTNCPADIRKECLRRVDEVNAQIPTIIFEAKDASGRDLSAVKVTMDGQLIADRLEGTALSMDPGEHTFMFEAAGQPAITRQFVMRESQKDRREALTFGQLAAIPPPANVAPNAARPEPPPASALAAPTSDSAEPSAGLGMQKIVGIVAAGIGVVGLGLGSTFGLIAISKKNDAQGACPNLCADQAGVSMWSDAKTAAMISDVAFVVGGLGLAGGAVLWFTAKPPPYGSASAQVGLGPGSIQLKGVW